MAVVCKQKGSDAYAETVAAICLHNLRHPKIIVHSDGENPMKKLIDNIIATDDKFVPETAPRYSSQSTGKAEGFVGISKGNLVTNKLFFESKMKEKLSVLHPVFDWLVLHVNWLLVRFRNIGGHSPFWNIRMKEYIHAIFDFGQMVYVRDPSPEAHNETLQKRFLAGCWLGRSERTD